MIPNAKIIFLTGHAGSYYLNLHKSVTPLYFPCGVAKFMQPQDLCGKKQIFPQQNRIFAKNVTQELLRIQWRYTPRHLVLLLLFRIPYVHTVSCCWVTCVLGVPEFWGWGAPCTWHCWWYNAIIPLKIRWDHAEWAILAQAGQGSTADPDAVNPPRRRAPATGYVLSGTWKTEENVKNRTEMRKIWMKWWAMKTRKKSLNFRPPENGFPIVFLVVDTRFLKLPWKIIGNKLIK